MQSWTGFLGIEIYNAFIARIEGEPDATAKWDVLLSAGQRVWGFANDDSHEPQHVGQAWNTAFARERNIEGVVEALVSGRFYGSTGVTISAIEVDALTVRIATENAQRIEVVAGGGARIAVTDNSSIEFQVPNDTKYVRFVCTGVEGQRAWTQPFFVS